MKIKSLFLFMYVIIIFSSAATIAQQDDVTIIGPNEISRWLTEYNVPAAGIGVIKDGKLNHSKVYGELFKGHPVNDNTIFKIASLTKTIVAIVTLKLVEAKQWDLDEPLYKYWIDPDIENDKRHKKLTTRHILSHQSGFPNWRSDTPNQKLIFSFDPGSKYQYSGEGFEYLKKALAQKFQTSLEELSEKILFTPLGMKNTKYYWGESIDSSRFAFGHNDKGEIYQENIQNHASAAYGLLTTVTDYTKFGIDVINQAGLSNGLFTEMVSTQVNIKNNVDQGLGWQIIRNLPNGEYALLHEGGSNGVSSLVVLLPVSKCGIVVFTNGDKGDAIYSNVLQGFLKSGKDIINKMNQMSYNPEQIKTVKVSDDILQSYTGSYLIPSFQMSVKIIYQDHVLKLESPYSTMVLYPETETNFFLKDDDLRIEFVKDENQKTSGIFVIYKGKEPEFAKRTE